MWDECDRNCGWFHDDHDSSPIDGPNKCRKKDFEKDPYVDYHCSGNRKLQECVHECMRRGNDNDIWRVVFAIDHFVRYSPLVSVRKEIVFKQ
jgi:hypothetical protein